MEFDFDDDYRSVHASSWPPPSAEAPPGAVSAGRWAPWPRPEEAAAAAQTCCVQPPPEEAFVSTQVAVRVPAYRRLEAYLSAGGDSRPFQPWFRELLMEADAEGFAAACAAVAAHYRRCERKSQLAPLAPLGAWLPALAERAKNGNSADQSASRELLFAAVQRCGKEDLCEQLLRLWRSDAEAALHVLATCVECGAADIVDVRGVLHHDSVKEGLSTRLVGGSDCVRRAILTLQSALPDLTEGELPTVTVASPLVPIATPSVIGTPSKECSTKASPGDLTSFERPLVIEDDVLQLLGDSSVRSWQRRLACLQGLDVGLGEGQSRGPALWPGLVRQAEDDHPAVACEALRAISRLAHWLGDPGDHLATRLAASIRSRFREARARGVEASCACVRALAMRGVLGVAPLTAFLTHALQCPRDRARAAALAASSAAMVAARAVHCGLPGYLREDTSLHAPAELESLLSAASMARRRGSGGGSILASQSGACPVGGAPGAVMTPSPAPSRKRHNGSPAAQRTSNLTPFGAASPVEFATPSILPMPSFSPSASFAHKDASSGDENDPLQWTFGSTHVGTGPRTPMTGCRTPMTASRTPISRGTSSRYAILEDSPGLPRAPRQSPAVTAGSLATPPRRGTPSRQSEGSPSGCGRQVSLDQAPPLQPSIARTPPRRWGPPRGHSLGAKQRSPSFPQVVAPSADMFVSASSCSIFDGSLDGPPSRFISPSKLMLSGASCANSIGDHALSNPVDAILRAFAEGEDASPNAVDAILRVLAEGDGEGGGRPMVSESLDSCLAQLLAASGRGQVQLARFLRELATRLDAVLGQSSPDSVSLTSLPLTVDAAVGGKISRDALPHLCAALELLVRRLAPRSVPERTWTQMRQLFRRYTVGAGPATPAVASSPFAPPARSPTLSKTADAEDRTLSAASRAEESGGDACAAPAGGTSELASSLSRLHRLATVDLAKSDNEDMLAALQQIAQLLLRPQLQAPLRSLLRRLLARQRLRMASKENLPPSSTLAKQPATGFAIDFIEADYASIRELMSDEGLVGTFPLSLVGELKRVLSIPLPVPTHRAAMECITAVAEVCGPLLLKVLLNSFAGPLLRFASSRSPLQAPARTALSALASVSELPSSHGISRWLRLVWRALFTACRRIASGGSGASDRRAFDPGLLIESLRWLADDALASPGATVGADVSRELLASLALILHDRSTVIRQATGRAIWALSQVRGELALRTDVRSPQTQLTNAERESVLVSLDRLVEEHSAKIASIIPKNDSDVNPANQNEVIFCSTAPLKALATAGSSSSSSKPRRLQFSPMVDDPLSPPSMQFPPRPRSFGCSAAPTRPPLVVYTDAVHGDTSPPGVLSKPGGHVETQAPREQSASDSMPRWPTPLARPSTPQHPMVSPSSAPDLTVARRRAAELRAAEAEAGRGRATGSGLATTPATGGVGSRLARPSISPCRGSSLRTPSLQRSLLSPRYSNSLLSTPTGGRLSFDLECELASWTDTVAEHEAKKVWDNTAWGDFVSSLGSRLENVLIRCQTNEAALLIVSTLVLCEGLVTKVADVTSLEHAHAQSENEDISGLLAGAVDVASAARKAFSPTALKGLCVVTAAQSFRAALRTLSLLQYLSRAGVDATRRTAARALLEIPLLFASIIDSLDVSTQLVAWIRVASEVLDSGDILAAGSRAGFATTAALVGTRRWALKFCTRCLQRAAPLLPKDGSEFPAWEVLSEVSRVHALSLEHHSRAGDPKADAAWRTDCDEWLQVLQELALIVAQRCPAQAREFLLLASCAGSPLPPAMEGLLRG